MMVTGSRMRQIGWLASLGLCVGIFAVLSFNVHAVKSEVLLTERKVVSLKREMILLETEFQTRASQRQLANWNAVDFGYEAPRADQYVDGERELAKLGQPASPNAPAPVRVARGEMLASNQSTSRSMPRQGMTAASGQDKADIAHNRQASKASTAFAEAFGGILDDASPIGSARAQITSNRPPE